MIFEDRAQAGRRLAEHLIRYAERRDVVALGLPRGGVVVAYEIAQALKVPLDVFVVRKLGVPGQEELAMGAIATGGYRYLNQEVIRALEISKEVVDSVTAREEEELKRRERIYHGGRRPVEVRGKSVILVDDGLATGSTMRAAIMALRPRRPARIVVAVPVGSVEACADMRRVADEVVCLSEPDPFYGVGVWYQDFSQATDEQVRELLDPPGPVFGGAWYEREDGSNYGGQGCDSRGSDDS